MGANTKRKPSTDKEKPNARLRTLLRSGRARGVKPITDFDKFLEETGDPEPERDSVDDFIALIRKMRRDGRRR